MLHRFEAGREQLKNRFSLRRCPSPRATVRTGRDSVLQTLLPKKEIASMNGPGFWAEF